MNDVRINQPATAKAEASYALELAVEDVLKKAGITRHTGVDELERLVPTLTAMLVARPELMRATRRHSDDGFPAVCRLEALLFAAEHCWDGLNNHPDAKQHLAMMLRLMDEQIKELRQDLYGPAGEP